MKKSILIPLVLLGTVFFTQCNSKKEEPTPALTKTQLLVRHSWIITNSTADVAVNYDGDAGTAASTDVWSQKPSCAKDDYLYFSASGNPKTGYKHENSNVCTTPAKTDFTWAFSTDETKITITIASVPVESKLLKLDENTLKVSYPALDADGLSYTQTDTYSKKVN